MPVEFRYLTQEEVLQAGGLDMDLAIQDVENVFRLWATGDCILPSKVVLRWGDIASEKTRGHINAMPGYVGGDYDMAGLKWAAAMYRNPFEFGLPAISALTILNHPTLGLPVAAMDGTLISAVRTAAVTGVAARYLARPDSQTVGIIGAGVQNRTQLMALKAALPDLVQARVYDLREEQSVAFCREMRDRLDMSVEVVGTGQAAASQADVLVSATSTPPTSPVVLPGWVPEGCLYCQIAGNDCDPKAIPEFDKIVVDNWSEIQHRETPALARAKAQGTIDDSSIYAELGDIVVGKRPGRENRSERILMSAVGMGIEDIAVATRILRRAEQAQLGTILRLWETPIFV
jgi:ornithine cyclodeaminase/alanine dehydrogenase-like protein (mu-crystallin family)